ncbi:hypothetical protein [Hyalangium rubrum]|uniref:Lipoprotein n=1 Tax=Hyalangium rubrum TaxID=3103134 RepID=A0ABU5H3X7_9BACT|nr:hypothetical protein [Hyalangium sp. s54d21]MDY7228167.1 hypothetical protein [Hyalangium sp. s54d21]
MKMTMRNLGGALLGLALAACGPTELTEETQALPLQEQGLLEAGCTALGPVPVSHACGHLISGPYASATASASSTDPSMQSINSTHTAYTVTLPGSGSSYTGTVKFVPSRTSSAWAFFVSANITVVLKDASGNTVTPAFSPQSISQTGCGLSQVVVYNNLTKDAVYKLTLGPSTTSTVQVIPERVEDSRVYYFQDADSDGYGNTNVYTLTACTPPAGYVLDDTDCNDANAAVHTGC